MQMKFRSLACLAATSFLLMVGAPLAHADPPVRTRGDAQAVFQAGFTGGTNINILRNANGHGAPTGILPTGDPQDVRIYPFAEDAAYCASGWHVLNFFTGDFVDAYDSRQELVSSLASVDILYELDGTPLQTQRTALKHVLLGDEDPFVGFSVGALLPPGTLMVGDHQLTTTFIDPIYGDFTVTVDLEVLPC